jgi:fructose-1,6-bisphosphatase-3
VARDTIRKSEQTAVNHALLHALAEKFPNREFVLTQLGLLRARATLPKGVIHVLSDVHGEAEKLKHIINNCSGGLRPLLEEVFAGNSDSRRERRIDSADFNELLTFIYYPRETWLVRRAELETAKARSVLVHKLVPREVEVLRFVARRYDLGQLDRILPSAYAPLFREWIFARHFERSPDFFAATLADFCNSGGELELLRCLARTIRNLFVSELIVAGDFGDRGPRIDGVIDCVMEQPNVAITWGNHDASWMGASLGQPACVATVLRMSVRYGRLSQLEQGYGIPLKALEQLAEAEYGNDPCAHFEYFGPSLRNEPLLRRMQKAIAILQFKLESQTIRRNPQFKLQDRDLLPRIDPEKGTVRIDNKDFALRDRDFPTIDWDDASRLSESEGRCLAEFTELFLQSSVLSQQMSYLMERGRMWLRRDCALIFHGCVPVDEAGKFLPFEVLGKTVSGRELFDALESAVRLAFHKKNESALDLLWYLWAGPLSPVFGKDKLATFESYFVAEKEARTETKNPYFHLIRDRGFCQKILGEFDVDLGNGLIVNGHVPVKIDKGESPLKASGQAVTIDGAFSEVYGDHGYTLVLEADRTFLAQHHHFASVADAITRGTDIVPSVQVIQQFVPPRTVADTEIGREVAEEIAMLEALLRAYDENQISPRNE